MTLAFYAPLKPPDHPVPSGDRTMARSVLAALSLAGYSIDTTSNLRIYDKMGDAAVQDRLFAEAAAEVKRLVADPRAHDWQAWITYHNYYKAPDLIGPQVAKRLGIPYFQIEATRANKRLKGPWARFAEAAHTASDAAGVILYFTAQDADALHRDATEGQRLIHLRPFLARADLPSASDQSGPMLSVGMMRPGDKLASYALIAETLGQLTGDWRLDIAGDGPARPEVATMMSRFGNRVRFLGQLDPAQLTKAYGTARLLFWPGVNEAFGLAYLEAQAAGLPVVAQDRPGVCDVVHAVRTPVAEGPRAMAGRLSGLLTDADACRAEGLKARAAIETHHLLGAAARTLGDAIEALV